MRKKLATVATATILSTTLSTTVFADTYTVQSGDTLTRIAQKYNTTVSNIKTLNNLSSDRLFVNQTLTVPASSSSSSQSTTVQVASASTASAQTYTVVSGDSLIKIANNFGITLAELKTWNNISSTTIYPGQVFYVSNPGSVSGNTIPSTTTSASGSYTINSGDTLSKIAKLYGTTVSQLKAWNGLSSDIIYAGQTLKVNATVTTSSNTGKSTTPVTTTISTQTTTIINEAKKLLGIPYVWGGATASGFDCSGFVYYVFNKAGMSLSRYSTQGFYDRSYDVNSPQAGDIVFFENTYKQGISHMGIYLGDNQFIHAGSDGVQISSLTSTYWNEHFNSYKRFY